MSRLQEVIRLYRNDPYVSDILFEKFIDEAYEIEEEKTSRNQIHSINVMNLLERIDEKAFDVLVNLKDRFEEWKDEWEESRE